MARDFSGIDIAALRRRSISARFNSAWWGIVPLAYGVMLAKFGPSVALPSRCAFQWFLGIDCPACGLSTGLVRLLSGDIGGATTANLAAAPVLLLLTVSVAKASFHNRALDSLFHLSSRTALVALVSQFLLQFDPLLLSSGLANAQW